MVTEATVKIVAGRAGRTHARAGSVAMDSDFARCEFCAMVPIASIS